MTRSHAEGSPKHKKTKAYSISEYYCDPRDSMSSSSMTNNS